MTDLPERYRRTEEDEEAETTHDQNQPLCGAGVVGYIRDSLQASTAKTRWDDLGRRSVADVPLSSLSNCNPEGIIRQIGSSFSEKSDFP